MSDDTRTRLEGVRQWPTAARYVFQTALVLAGTLVMAAVAVAASVAAVAGALWVWKVVL